MAEEQESQSSTEEQKPPTEPVAESQDEVSGESTLADVEAHWRKRVSNSDKMHAAENKVLRQQLEAANKSQPTESGSSGEDGSKATIETLTKQLAEQTEGRKVDALGAKYPKAAEALGDGNVLASMDEARLAKLNESLTIEQPTPLNVDPNNPPRATGGSKPFSEMSVKELGALARTLPIELNQ